MSRHSSLAEQLAPILAYRDIEQSANSSISSGYSAEDIADLHEERRIGIRPTLSEIMQSVKSGPIERNEQGRIVQIGKLRFSDGTQTERTSKLGIDGKVIEDNIRMPVGAMLGCKEAQERVLGGGAKNDGESNAFFCTAFCVVPVTYKTSGKINRISKGNCAIDYMLAVYRAYTGDITKCPDGMAMGTPHIADNFIGMRMQPKAIGGSISWTDLSDKLAEREEYLAIERNISEQDKKEVTAAIDAKSLGHFGQSVGMSAQYARQGGGKKRLLALAQRLSAVI